jgi:hypothetical protein
MINITAFRATDNPALTARYIEGHRKVLEVYGVTKVTSNDTKWVDDTHTVVIHVESEDGKTLGGARIQIAGKHNKLPLADAVGEIDPLIYKIIDTYSEHNTGEFCGLWNSREVAGLGIGSIFLGRVGISLISRLGLGSLFALCSPATLKHCLNVGFNVLHEIGNDGTFYYPKEDLLATALIIPDPLYLASANSYDRDRILELRNNPRQITKEIGPRGPVEISYDLLT